jgi:hypothetical protein
VNSVPLLEKPILADRLIAGEAARCLRGDGSSAPFGKRGYPLAGAGDISGRSANGENAAGNPGRETRTLIPDRAGA